jgi:hypothetical protein
VSEKVGEAVAGESQALVAHTCKPTYSGGRDQEGCDLRPTLGEIVWETLSQKYPSQKRACGLAQGEGPEFKPQYCKKKKERKPKVENQATKP